MCARVCSCVWVFVSASSCMSLAAVLKLAFDQTCRHTKYYLKCIATVWLRCWNGCGSAIVHKGAEPTILFAYNNWILKIFCWLNFNAFASTKRFSSFLIKTKWLLHTFCLVEAKAKRKKWPICPSQSSGGGMGEVNMEIALGGLWMSGGWMVFGWRHPHRRSYQYHHHHLYHHHHHHHQSVQLNDFPRKYRNILRAISRQRKYSTYFGLATIAIKQP